MTRKWFRRLQLSRRSARAMEEAALDWRLEAAAAETFLAVLRVHLRNTAALIRVVVGSALQEARVFVPTYWSIAIPAVLIVIVGVPWISSFDRTFFDYPNVRALGWLTLSLTFTRALPAAVFIALVAADRRRPAPLLAICVSTVTLVLVMTIAVLPAFWRHYAEVGLRRPGFFPSAPYYALAPSLIFRIVGACLLGDRVRVDPKRRALLLGAFGLVTLLFGPTVFGAMARDYGHQMSRGSAEMLAWALFLPSMAARTVRFLVQDLPLPILSMSLWYVLVKRQERLAQRTTDTTPETSSSSPPPSARR